MTGPTAGDAVVGPQLAYSEEEPGDYELPFDSLEEFVPELEDEEAYTAMIAPPPPKKLLMGLQTHIADPADRLRAIARADAAAHNLIVSHVPDPQAQLYFLGSEVEAMYPLGPLFHGCGLNVTVMSLNGKLNFGVVSCPELLPDLWRLVDDFDVALEELLERIGPGRI